MRSDPVDPASMLPLTPLAFDILVCLAAGVRHGYAILQELAERSEADRRLNAGSLYRTIARLVDAGLVAELEHRPQAEGDDARRRYYGLTRMGRAVAAAEAQRLERAVAAARARNVLPKPRTV